MDITMRGISQIYLIQTKLKRRTASQTVNGFKTIVLRTLQNLIKLSLVYKQRNSCMMEVPTI